MAAVDKVEQKNLIAFRDTWIVPNNAYLVLVGKFPARAEMLRLITGGKLSPEEAVRAYHGVLQGKGIKPHRSLDDDLKLTDSSMSYDGSTARRATSLPGARTADRQAPIVKADWPKRDDGSPDFDSMSAAQRLAYDRSRLERKFR